MVSTMRTLKYACLLSTALAGHVLAAYVPQTPGLTLGTGPTNARQADQAIAAETAAANAATNTIQAAQTCTGTLSLALPNTGYWTYPVTLTANCTIGFTGGSATANTGVVLVLTEGSGGNFTPTLTNVFFNYYAGGAAPNYYPPWDLTAGDSNVVAVSNPLGSLTKLSGSVP